MRTKRKASWHQQGRYDGQLSRKGQRGVIPECRQGQGFNEDSSSIMTL